MQPISESMRADRRMHLSKRGDIANNNERRASSRLNCGWMFQSFIPRICCFLGPEVKLLREMLEQLDEKAKSCTQFATCLAAQAELQ